MTENKWGVWCTVDGGVTGHREAWLKAGNNVKVWMGTEEEARFKAEALMKTGRSPYSTAVFTYTARILPILLGF